MDGIAFLACLHARILCILLRVNIDLVGSPQASVNARYEGLESVTIATTSGVNERPTGVILLIEVESFDSDFGSTRSTVHRFFTDR